MAYVKILNNEAVEYPYSDAMLKRDNKNVSFPSSMNDAIRSSYGMLPVIIADAPIYNAATQKIITDTMPTRNEETNTWVLNHSVVDMTSEEIAEYNTKIATHHRTTRNKLLADSDWTQMNDSPLTNEVKTAWATYRQELRDLSDLDAWPNLDDADWPVAP